MVSAVLSVGEETNTTVLYVDIYRMGFEPTINLYRGWDGVRNAKTELLGRCAKYCDTKYLFFNAL